MALLVQFHTALCLILPTRVAVPGSWLLPQKSGFLPAFPASSLGACCWYQSSIMVYNVVKNVSVGMFIQHYPGNH